MNECKNEHYITVKVFHLYVYAHKRFVVVVLYIMKLLLVCTKYHVC
jgi:hypothetical protein